MVRTEVTFAEACEEYLRWLERDRQRKPSTLRDYRGIIRTHLRRSSAASPSRRSRPSTSRRGPPSSARPAAEQPHEDQGHDRLFGSWSGRAAAQLPLTRSRPREADPAPAADIDVFTPEEVMALVRPAESEQDARSS
jgi:hypothetical protein